MNTIPPILGMGGNSSSQSQPKSTLHGAHTEAEPSDLAARLARWIDPTAFATHRMSSRNQHAANKRRTMTLKLAKKVLKFHPLAKALGRERSPAWQPIETAPRDGTEIMLGAPAQAFAGRPTAPRSTVGHWTTEEECRVYLGDCGGVCRCPEYDDGTPSWISWDGGFTPENPPTHWMPLPGAPS